MVSKITEDVMINVSRKKRIMLSKLGCPNCAEVSRAVSLFNSDTDRKIKTVYANDVYGRKFINIFRYIFGSSILTPVIYFDGHVLKWEQGGPEWLETYYLLKELSRR